MFEGGKHYPAGSGGREIPCLDSLDFTLSRLDSKQPTSCDQWSGLDLHTPGYRSPVGLLPSYSTSDLSKSRCRWTQSCKVALAITLLILLAWGIAVPLYFLVGPGMFFHGGGPVRLTPISEAQVAQSASTINGTVLNAVNGSMILVNQRYTPHLDNHFTAHYQSLKVKIETLISIIFGKMKDFNKAAVMRFRPETGRVRVYYVLIFHKNRAHVKEVVHSTLLNYLSKHWTMLGSFQVDMGSLQINNIQNQCAIDNGGCSHLCFWNLLSDGYECRCPQHYQLLGDQHTCFPSVLQRETTTANPCGEGSFACRSSNCIPNTWLCDGVSDCLLGEDEAQHFCESLKAKYLENATEKSAKLFTLPTSVSLYEVRKTQETTLKSQQATTTSSTAAPVVWQLPSTTPIDFPIPSLAVDPESWISDNTGFHPKHLDRPHKYKYFG